MPAFTMVAEWRKALMGVGASIAFGSQMWKGHWALLVAAPRTMSKKAARDTLSAMPGMAMSFERCHSPVAWPSKRNPASMASPPPPVMRTAFCAP